VVSVEGIEIANYPLGPSTAGRPLSEGAVDFLLTQRGGPWGGPPPTPVVMLPIKLTDESLASGNYSTVFAAHQFTCPSGAVWDLKGRVVRNPHPAHDQDDPLDRSQVNVADGYVLVSLPSQP
jgi:hypothetical protein